MAAPKPSLACALALALAMALALCGLAAASYHDLARTDAAAGSFAYQFGVQLALPNNVGFMHLGGSDGSTISAAVLLSTDNGHTWPALTVTTPFPARQAHMATVLADGATVIVAGGIAADASTTLADVWTASSADNYAVWSQVSQTGLPALSYARMDLVGSTLVVTGGLDSAGSPVDTTYLSTDGGATWTAGATFTYARYHHATATLSSDRLLLAFGQASYGLYFVQEYSLSSNTWSAAWEAGSFAVGYVQGGIGNYMTKLSNGMLLYQSSTHLYHSKDEGVTWKRSRATSASLAAYDGSTPLETSDGAIVLIQGGTSAFVSHFQCATDFSRTTDFICAEDGVTHPVISSHGSTTVQHSVVLALPNRAGMLQLGGTGYPGYSNAVKRSTDNGATWTDLPQTSPYTGRIMAVGAMYPDGTVVLQGGRTSSSVFVYDIWTGGAADDYATWSQVNPTGLPEVAAMELTLVGTTLVMTGGITYPEGGGSVYHSGTFLSSNGGATWSTGADFTGGRFGHATAALDDERMLLAFGLGVGGEYGNAANMVDVQEYNVATNTWRQVAATTAAGEPGDAPMIRLATGTLAFIASDYVYFSQDSGATWTPGAYGVSSQSETLVETTDGIAITYSYGEEATALLVACSNPAFGIRADFTCAPSGVEAASLASLGAPGSFPFTDGVQLVLPNGAGLMQISGYDNANAAVTGAVLLSTDNGETWVAVPATTPFPARQTQMTTVLADGVTVVVAGGSDGSSTLGDMWISDGSNYGVWSQVTQTVGSELPALNGARMTLVGATLVATGGQDSSGVDQATTYTSTDGGVTWVQGADFVTARSFHSAAAVDDDTLLLAFGSSASENRRMLLEGTSHTDVQQYSVSTDTWSQVAASSAVPGPAAGNIAVLASGTMVVQAGSNLYASSDGGVTWTVALAGLDAYSGATPMETEEGIVIVQGGSSAFASRLGCELGSSLNADIMCESNAEMHQCTAAASTSLLQLGVSSSSSAITTTLLSGANSPSRIFTSAVLRVPVAGGGTCDYNVMKLLTCDASCVCSLDVSPADLAASCIVDASVASFEATFLVTYEDRVTDLFTQLPVATTYATQASTTVISGQGFTASAGSASVLVTSLHVVSNSITPAADAGSDASMAINIKLVSPTSVDSIAVAAVPTMVDGTADTADDITSIAAAAAADAVTCGSATCSHNFVLTLTSLASICKFDGTITMQFAPTCTAGGECDATDDAFEGVITIAQPFDSQAACAPTGAAAAGVTHSLTAVSSAALVTSASTAVELAWDSFLHETGDTAATFEADMTSVKMGLYTSSDTCDAGLVTLQEVHDGTALTSVGAALGSLSVDTSTSATTHSVKLSLTLSNVINMAALGVHGADESRKIDFTTNYRTLVCTVVTRTLPDGFGTGRRLSVTTASASSIKAGAASGEVVALLPPANADEQSYLVDSATVASFRFTTADADVLDEPAVRELLRNAVTAALAHAAGMSASQIVVTRMDLVQGTDRAHAVHVQAALVLRGSAAAVVVQHESAVSNLAGATADGSLGASIERKLSLAGVNNMQHAAASVSREAPLPSVAAEAPAQPVIAAGNDTGDSTGMNLVTIVAIAVAGAAFIGLLAALVVMRRRAVAAAKVQPTMPSSSGSIIDLPPFPAANWSEEA